MQVIWISALLSIASASPAANTKASQDDLLTSFEAPGNYICVRGAGDVNGDGVPDVVCGDYQSGVSAYSGATGSLLWNQPGSHYWSLLGWEVDAMGDVNGDGKADIVAGAPGEDVIPGANEGAAHILSGADGSSILTVYGPVADVDFGKSVAALGDVNGDGLGDFAVSAPDENQDAGVVRVYSGADGALLLQVPGACTGCGTMSVLAGPGDLNGDGHADWVVGARFDDGPAGNSSGTVRAFSGLDGSQLWVVVGGPTVFYLGSAVDKAGDVDGDGTPDILAGAPSSSLGGRALVLSGLDGSVLHDLRGAWSGDAFEEYGTYVGALGDVDGDGHADVAVGGYMLFNYEDPIRQARIEVRSGSDGHVLYTRYRYYPGNDNARFGVGDVDLDGTPDILFVAPFSATSGTTPVEVWSGAPTRPGSAFCSTWASFDCPCSNPDFLAGCKNATGEGARIRGEGSSSIASDDLEIVVERLPSSQFGILFMGDAVTSVFLGNGQRCVAAGAAGLFRFQPPQLSSATGTLRWGPGLVALSQTSFASQGHLTAGATWHFQAWYRDPLGPCGNGSNLSNAYSVSLRP